MEVGAVTSNTATFLRSIGPEPWRAAYVQPSRRPKDGRYGKNPNHLQHYYQFQVVLQPAPMNILDLFIGPLAALRSESVRVGKECVRTCRDTRMAYETTTKRKEQVLNN